MVWSAFTGRRKEKPGDEQSSTASESLVGINRKKIMGTNLPEERKVMREPLPSTSRDYSCPEISCHSRVPPCNRASALAPRDPLFSSKIALFLFPYWRLPPKSVRAENVTKTIAFPRSSCLLTVNAGGSVISLASGFSCWHISLIRRAMFTNLWRGKTRIRFSRESFLFKRIYRVCRIDGFPWNLARTCTDD